MSQLHVFISCLLHLDKNLYIMRKSSSWDAAASQTAICEQLLPNQQAISIHLEVNKLKSKDLAACALIT